MALYDSLKGDLEDIKAKIVAEGEQHTASLAAATDALNAKIAELEAKLAELSTTPEQAAELVALVADIKAGVTGIVPDA